MSETGDVQRKPPAAIRATVAVLAHSNEIIAGITIWIAAAMIAFSALALALVLGALERQWQALQLPLVNDLPPMLMPWIVFLLIGTMVREGGHITVDVLDHWLAARRKARRAADIAIHVVVLLISAAFLYGGSTAVGFFVDLGEMTDSDVQFPVWWIYLAFPVGFALVVLVAVEGLLRAVFSIERPARQPGAEGVG